MKNRPIDNERWCHIIRTSIPSLLLDVASANAHQMEFQIQKFGYFFRFTFFRNVKSHIECFTSTVRRMDFIRSSNRIKHLRVFTRWTLLSDNIYSVYKMDVNSCLEKFELELATQMIEITYSNCRHLTRSATKMFFHLIRKLNSLICLHHRTLNAFHRQLPAANFVIQHKCKSLESNRSMRFADLVQRSLEQCCEVRRSYIDMIL